MTLNFSTDDAVKLAFPDCRITNFHASESALQFSSDGVFVDGLGLIGARCNVECQSSGQLRVRRFADDEWSEIDPPPASGLREICEWSVEDGDLKIAGFETVTGMWSEYLLPAFSMKAIVEE